MSEEIEQTEYSDSIEQPEYEAEETEIDGDPETDTAEDDGEEVEYEGKQYKLPPELKDALLRQSDYTRKTQEVAEQRRAVEAQRAQAEQAVQLVSQFQKEYAQLSTVDAQLERLSGLDWNAAINENPVEAMKLQARFNELRMQREQIAGNINQIQQQTEQQRQAEIAKAIQESEAVLKREIPNWNIDVENEIAHAAVKHLGFTYEELRGVKANPKFVKTLYGATQYFKSLDQLKKPTPNATPIQPTKTVKSAKPAPRGLSDDLPTDEWMKRREAELKKQGRR